MLKSKWISRNSNLYHKPVWTVTGIEFSLGREVWVIEAKTKKRKEKRRYFRDVIERNYLPVGS